jgi:cellulose synthase/poly-beta-1,6-N-acetylglucosamine synthase-like glycosyltransferase
MKLTTVEAQEFISCLNFVSLAPYVDKASGLRKDPVDPIAARLVDSAYARCWKILPFQRVGSRCFVAAAQPEAVDLSMVLAPLGLIPVVFRCDPTDLLCAQDRVYGLPEKLPDQRLGGLLMRSGKIGAASILRVVKDQDRTGTSVGAGLAADNAVNHWDVAEAIARQNQVPVVDLLNAEDQWVGSQDRELEPIWSEIPEEFWRLHLTVPIGITEDTLIVATVNPGDKHILTILENKFGKRVRMFATGYRDITHVLDARYRAQHVEHSRWALFRNRPSDSAYRQLSNGQAVALLAIGTVLVVSLVANALITGLVISILLQAGYTAYNAFRLWLMYTAAKDPAEIVIEDREVAEVDRKGLPVYTLLVPLYREANVIGQLVAALSKLDYPKDRLDVKLLLEEDDKETIAAAREAGLPNFMELVVVPASEPRTKPKACNYGLAKARGEYVVIYDAEDVPESDQLLKAVIAFRNSPTEVACVQAKLDYFNPEQNILTKWFATEYANWFDLMLPALFSTRMPIPLGGTSNHLKTDVLRSIGTWDPFNVTEDADLGIRLHKAGYRTIIMNSTTYEEANANLVNWVRQRSRWLKGYIQTWLVHMRHPRKLIHDMGWRDALAFNAMVGGTPFTVLLNPWLWALTLSWYILGPNFSQQLFPGIVYYIAMMNLFIGNFVFVFINMVGLAKRQHWSLVIPAALTPIYWLLMSIAAWKGFWQLISRPWYWEKTTHGLTNDGAFSVPIQTTASRASL